MNEMVYFHVPKAVNAVLPGHLSHIVVFLHFIPHTEAAERELKFEKNENVKHH